MCSIFMVIILTRVSVVEQKVGEFIYVQAVSFGKRLTDFIIIKDIACAISYYTAVRITDSV